MVVTRATGVSARLVATAQRYCDRQGRRRVRRIAELSRLVAVPDEAICRDVADRFERQPRVAYDEALARRYRRLKYEIHDLYDAVVDAGIAVEPWLQPGQPYRDLADLVRKVRETATIHVFLTRNGHGPAGSTGFHPLREPSGVIAGGTELTHNDLFRVVHDVFGHVMFGHGFGPAGELTAAYCQMALLSESSRFVVCAEQVAQTCWFFYGPHLRDEAGRLQRPGDRGYVPPRRRPFPEQKVFAAERRDLAAFERMVVPRAAS
jgi:hypothetical protein